MKIDVDLWPQIQPHAWKYQSGRVDVVGIIWHATRSGIPNRPAALEFQSACNWFISPHNAVLDSAGNKWYSGMSSYIIGGGRVARAVPEELVPRFSAGIHDFRAISIEMAQGTNGDPYEERDVLLSRELATELATKYGFPLGRIPFVNANNQGWPGEVGHEDTAQGRQQGKSDPGSLWWTQYNMEDGMTPNELYRLERMEKILGGFGIAKDPVAYVASGQDPSLLIFGEEALEYAFGKQWSAFLGVGITRAELGVHLTGHNDGDGGMLAHNHDTPAGKTGGVNLP